jgi:hypothetical protein
LNTTVNPHAAVGAGRTRKPWRIREWLDGQGINYATVAARAGIKATSIVCRTVRGGANNRRVLLALLDMGCPERWLGLPEDLRSQIEQGKRRIA